ncbi:PTS mannose transporter subunit IIB, partial [Salmonella enterica]|nr:PTS mannose transporter subunit IIB [Salmonella enterica]
FRWYILRFDIKTPGRKETLVEVKTKKDYLAAKENNEQVRQIIDALGGAENILDVDACITRLRVTVKDSNFVKDNEYWINKLGAKGLVKVGTTGVQVIYGAAAAQYKLLINNILEK